MIGSTRKTHRSRLRGMAVTVEMHNTGDPAQRAEVVSVVEHVLSDRPGDWRVSIVGSQANDRGGDEDCRAEGRSSGFRWRTSISSPCKSISTVWREPDQGTGCFRLGRTCGTSLQRQSTKTSSSKTQLAKWLFQPNCATRTGQP